MLDTIILIIGERLRQNALVESGALPFSCADPAIGPSLKLPVLGEEFGEVSTEVYELLLALLDDDAHACAAAVARLRTELIQLAAVACAWAESLSSRESTVQSPESRTQDPSL